MSWETKTDYCGIAIANKLLVKSATLNRTGQYLEKHGQNGGYAKTKAFGVRSAPSNTYTVAAEFELENVALGTVNTVDGKKYALESIRWTTGADQEPTVEATAAEVASGGATRNTFAVPELALSPDQIAQIALEAFTLPAGTEQAPKNVGCELVSCGGEISCKVGTNDQNGIPKAHDVTNGHIVVNVTIAQYGEMEPELTPGTGWDISSPLTCSDPDSDMPEWTATLTKPLTKTMAS